MIRLLALLTLLSLPLVAQQDRPVRFFPVEPTNPCSVITPLVNNWVLGHLWQCVGTAGVNNGTWNLVSGGGSWLISVPHDGVTNAQPALQSSINAGAASGGATIQLPCGEILLSGTGSQLLNFPGPGTVNIIGCGMSTNSASGTVLLVASSVASPTDVIHIVPGSAGMTGMVLKDFSIMPQTTGVARYGINIDTTSNYFANALIDHIYIGSLGAQAIASTNPTRTDGFFTSSIRDSYVTNGMLFTGLGDSINILRTSTTGANIGIQVVSFVPGAGNFHIEGNTLENTGGCIKLGDYQASGKILYNFCELGNGSTGSNGAAIDIDGGTNAGSNLLIVGNIVNTLAAASPTLANIRVNNASTTLLSRNTLERNSGASTSIVVTTNAGSTYIDNEYYVPTSDAYPHTYTDAGTGTVVAGTAHSLSTPRICNATGSATAQTCTTSLFYAPSAGDEFIVVTNTTNTGALTLNINGAGAIPVKKWGGSTAVQSGDVCTAHFFKMTLNTNGTSLDVDDVCNPPSASGGGAGVVVCSDATNTNSYVCAGSPAPSSLTNLVIELQVTHQNTGAVTINIATLGVKAAIFQDGTAFTGGEIQASPLAYTLYYDNSSSFRMQRPGHVPGASGCLSNNVSASPNTLDFNVACLYPLAIPFTGLISNTSSGVQTLTASTTVTVANNIQVTAASAITLTSTPNVAASTDGTEIAITNTGATYSIIFQDSGSLAGSGLSLCGANVTLAPKQALLLRYNSTLSLWVKGSCGGSGSGATAGYGISVSGSAVSLNPIDLSYIGWDETWTGTNTANLSLGTRNWLWGFNNNAPTISYVATDANHGQAMSVVGGAAANEDASILGIAAYIPGTATNWSAVDVIKTDSATTHLSGVTFGFNGFCTPSSGNCIGISYVPATSANWILVTCSGFSCSYVSTGVAYATSTWFKLLLSSTSAGTILAQVNSGSVVSEGSNVPTGTYALNAISFNTDSTGAARTFLINKTAYFQTVTRP